MAEALARAHVPGLIALSAGTMGWNGAPATDHAVEVLARRGIDMRHHVSRRLTSDDIDAADLVIAMTRIHAWATHAHHPGAQVRTFLFDEFLRAATRVPRAARPLRAWVEELGSARDPSAPPGAARDEIADPAGEELDVYEQTAARLERLTRSLATALRSDLGDENSA